MLERGQRLIFGLGFAVALTASSVLDAQAQEKPKHDKQFQLRDLFHKNYPKDISGLWDGKAQLFDEIEQTEDDSLVYQFDVQQDGNKLSADMYCYYKNKQGMEFSALTKMKGTYKKGAFSLETTELVQGDSTYTHSTDAAWCYRARLSGKFSRNENEYVMESAKYDVLSHAAFVGRGEDFRLTSKCNCVNGDANYDWVMDAPVGDPAQDTLFQAFQFNQSQSTLASRQDSVELGRLIRVLRENPEWHVELDGYTETRGNQQANYTLSRRRAEFIQDVLITYGIRKKRIDAQWHGGEQPAAANDEDKRHLNRRVEVRIEPN